jgi:hypothetical protein
MKERRTRHGLQPYEALSEPFCWKQLRLMKFAFLAFRDDFGGSVCCILSFAFIKRKLDVIAL